MNTDKMSSIASILLGLMMIIFGLNKFLGYIPVEPPSDATAQAFMGAMFTSYLFVVVALAEIVGGALLIMSQSRFIGWLMLLPVMFNIVAFHVAHDFIGNGIWLLPSFLFMAIGYSLKSRLTQLLNPTL